MQKLQHVVEGSEGRGEDYETGVEKSMDVWGGESDRTWICESGGMGRCVRRGVGTVPFSPVGRGPGGAVKITHASMIGGNFVRCEREVEE